MLFDSISFIADFFPETSSRRKLLCASIEALEDNTSSFESLSCHPLNNVADVIEAEDELSVDVLVAVDVSGSSGFPSEVKESEVDERIPACSNFGEEVLLATVISSVCKDVLLPVDAPNSRIVCFVEDSDIVDCDMDSAVVDCNAGGGTVVCIDGILVDFVTVDGLKGNKKVSLVVALDSLCVGETSIRLLVPSNSEDFCASLNFTAVE
ncbi:unnamed protein product [Toxocara canis]|uniref:Uncharacterized protein n=1 Tax=Toxocara canis TaxID=6265 RepID=A0A183U5J4_TOXCA|nr:unnamed protein product [Toxocara canis]